MPIANSQTPTVDSRNEHDAAPGSDARAVLEAINIKKTYRLGRADVPVLHDATLDIRAGEWLAVLGS